MPLSAFLLFLSLPRPLFSLSLSRLARRRRRRRRREVSRPLSCSREKARREDGGEKEPKAPAAAAEKGKRRGRKGRVKAEEGAKEREEKRLLTLTVFLSRGTSQSQRHALLLAHSLSHSPVSILSRTLSAVSIRASLASLSKVTFFFLAPSPIVPGQFRRRRRFKLFFFFFSLCFSPPLPRKRPSDVPRPS